MGSAARLARPEEGKCQFAKVLSVDTATGCAHQGQPRGWRFVHQLPAQHHAHLEGKRQSGQLSRLTRLPGLRHRRRLVLVARSLSRVTHRNPTFAVVVTVTYRQRRRFWKSLPGVITAAAGLISAIAALIGGLVAVGIIGGSHPLVASNAATHKTSRPSTSSHGTSGSGISGSDVSSYSDSGRGISSNGTPGSGTPSSGPPSSGQPPSGPPPSGPPPSHPPHVMVDQVNDPAWTGGVVNIIPANNDSQVFTPSLPHLIAIEVALMTINAGRGGDTVTLTVLAGNGQKVATTSAAIAEGFDGFWRFNLPDGGPPVTPGQPLTMMLQDSGKIAFGWKYADGSPYPRGQAYFGGSMFGTNDFLFRTYGAQQ